MDPTLQHALSTFDALLSEPAPLPPANRAAPPTMTPLAALRSFNPAPLPDAVKSFCRQYANQIRMGVPESHPSIMAYACYKRVFNDRVPRPGLAAVRNTLSVAASLAKLRACPARQLEYDRRAALRSMYSDLDPDTLAQTIENSAPASLAATQAAAVETPQERRARLLAHPPAHPSMVVFSEDSAGRLARRVHKREYSDWCSWQREATRETATRTRQLGLVVSEPAPVANSLAARGAARAALPWTQRRVEDLATIVALGRPVPRAQRHPLGHVLLPLRPHRENRQ